MEEICAGIKSFSDEKGEIRTYRYYMEITTRALGRFSCEAYGIRIAESGGESAEVADFTMSPTEADAFVGVLMDYSVTPVTLKDVAEDWRKKYPDSGARPAAAAREGEKLRDIS